MDFTSIKTDLHHIAALNYLGVAGAEIIIPTLILGFGAPIRTVGLLSQMVSIPTVVTGFVRHYRAGTLNDRELAVRLIVPMGLGAIAGGILGGLLTYVALQAP